MDANLFRTHTLRDERILRILAAALNAVEPGKIVKDFLAKTKLPSHKQIFLLGIGKASEAMTFSAAHVLTDFSDALIVTKHASFPSRERVTVIEAGHPIPDSHSLAAGQAALDFVSRLNEDDLLICLISGGGSALVSAPKDGITLEEIQSQTKKLLANGATIHEINNLRKQLDRIKGGGLARATKAKVVSLILSDVIGNSLETIASGLTVDATLGEHVQNFIVGDIQVAAQAARDQAIAEGFESEILDLQIQGEAREIGLQLAKRLKVERRKRTNKFCLIAGGETTVTIQGDGKGGRNQELALSAVKELSGVENILFISLATDGDDGPTDSAGAVVNGESRQRAEKFGMFTPAYLSRNDAYNFFNPLGDLIQCGYTGTNVNDLIFLIGL
jgi:hydroxypyruvate reductase